MILLHHLPGDNPVKSQASGDHSPRGFFRFGWAAQGSNPATGSTAASPWFHYGITSI